ETHPVDDVVEPRLEQLQQVLAGVALAALGLLEIAAELPLEDAVHALDLLLLAQLQPVVGRTCTRRASVLSGLAVELALRIEPPAGALKEKIGDLAAGKLRLRSGVACILKILAMRESLRGQSVSGTRPAAGLSGDGRWAS